MPELPISSAIAEAGSGAENLAELLDRDPEGYQQQDLTRVISALRAQRLRQEAADAAGIKLTKSAKAKTGASPSLASLGLKAN